MRRVLDAVYGGALIAACVAMVAIAMLVGVQILGRIADRVALAVGMAPPGIAIPSLSDFGGFLFVVAVTLALPATLRAGGHVRVTLLAGLMRGLAGRIAQAIVLLGALMLAGFAAWHSGVQAWDSWSFNTRSYGMVRTPLWIPQGVMTLGFALLVVAVLDEAWAVMRGRTPGYAQAEAERGIGGH
jgi:TRAP-type C4-dicarboxylate transport system permease small subunit